MDADIQNKQHSLIGGIFRREKRPTLDKQEKVVEVTKVPSNSRFFNIKIAPRQTRKIYPVDNSVLFMDWGTWIG